MFHWAEEDGETANIVDKISEIIEDEENNDLERIQKIYELITEKHEKGVI